MRFPSYNRGAPSSSTTAPTVTTSATTGTGTATTTVGPPTAQRIAAPITTNRTNTESHQVQDLAFFRDRVRELYLILDQCAPGILSDDQAQRLLPAFSPTSNASAKSNALGSSFARRAPASSQSQRTSGGGGGGGTAVQQQGANGKPGSRASSVLQRRVTRNSLHRDMSLEDVLMMQDEQKQRQKEQQQQQQQQKNGGVGGKTALKGKRASNNTVGANNNLASTSTSTTAKSKRVSMATDSRFAKVAQTGVKIAKRGSLDRLKLPNLATSASRYSIVSRIPVAPRSSIRKTNSPLFPPGSTPPTDLDDIAQVPVHVLHPQFQQMSLRTLHATANNAQQGTYADVPDLSEDSHMVG